MNINPAIVATAPDFNCPKCGGPHFNQAMRMKLIAGLLIGEKQTSFYPIPVFICIKCGYQPNNDDADIQLKEKSVAHPALVMPHGHGEA